MKRILFVLVLFISIVSVSGVMLEESRISYKNLIGEVYAARVEGEGEYLIDSKYNIIGGPYEYVSSYSGFPYAKDFDGSNMLFDVDGSVLLEAKPGTEAHPPANGIYALSVFGDNQEFIVYDYETRQELFRTEKMFYYHLELQSERMFIERDGKYAVIDKYGNYLTDFIYDSVKKRFNPDYAPYPKAYAIVIVDGEEKYIDRNFNEINLADYNGQRFITEFYPMKRLHTQSSRYYLAESGEYSAIFDMEKEDFIIPYQNEMTFVEADDSFIIVQKDGYYGIIDHSGNVVTDFEYKSLSLSPFEGFMYYSDGSYHGYFDPVRNCPVSEYASEAVYDGIMICQFFSADSRIPTTRIINFAGHDLTQERYAYVVCRDGEFYGADYYRDEPNHHIEIDRSFAVINLNGKYLPFDGAIRNGRTLVPVREITENLGGKVEWDADTMTATLFIDGNEISMSIGSNKLNMNGEEFILDVEAQLINNKTMIPVRALCEKLGASVDWDGRIRCVYINR